MGDGKKHDKFRGIDIPTLSYFCGKDSWKINPEGHLPKYVDKLDKLVADFEKLTSNMKTGMIEDPKALKEAKGLVKKILEIALLPKGVGNPKGFDFDEALGNYGQRTVDGVAIDMKRFLGEIGGMEEYKLLKQRLKEAKEDGFHSIEA